MQQFPRPALVIVDMQNDFVREGAPLEVPQARATFEQHRALIRHFRGKGLPIAFLRWVSVEDDPYVAFEQRFPWVRHLRPPVLACRPGHQRWYTDIGRQADCAAVVDELRPEACDLQVDKRGYGGFLGTALHGELQARGVRSLVVAGVVTEICVEDTVRQAFSLLYRTTVAVDAVASRNPQRQDASLHAIGASYGWLAGTAEIVAGI